MGLRDASASKNRFENCEQNATTWQQAKFNILNFFKIRITLVYYIHDTPQVKFPE